jgi:hypothetical protein
MATFQGFQALARPWGRIAGVANVTQGETGFAGF